MPSCEIRATAAMSAMSSAAHAVCVRVIDRISTGWNPYAVTFSRSAIERAVGMRIGDLAPAAFAHRALDARVAQIAGT